MKFKKAKKAEMELMNQSGTIKTNVTELSLLISFPALFHQIWIDYRKSIKFMKSRQAGKE